MSASDGQPRDSTTGRRETAQRLEPRVRDVGARPEGVDDMARHTLRSGNDGVGGDAVAAVVLPTDGRKHDPGLDWTQRRFVEDARQWGIWLVVSIRCRALQPHSSDSTPRRRQARPQRWRERRRRPLGLLRGCAAERSRESAPDNSTVERVRDAMRGPDRCQWSSACRLSARLRSILSTLGSRSTKRAPAGASSVSLESPRRRTRWTDTGCGPRWVPSGSGASA